MLAGIIIGSIITFLFVICIIAFAIINKKNVNSRRKKGIVAEKRVNQFLSDYASKHNMTFIPSNVYAYEYEGKKKYFEIDGILIGNDLMLVVEIKSINGTIYGDASAEKLNVKNSLSYTIKNPIVQNDVHIEHIEKIINDSFPIFSVIVLCEITRENIKFKPDHVILAKESKLKEELDSFYAAVDTKFKKIGDQKYKEVITKIKNQVANHEDLMRFYEITKRFN
ncbi:Nuclease-related domain [Mycoplasmopsis californica]|uniref:NERD domain-containing protein n=1 Tax=Mycoplasmopsis equigenitalium TaxID=114883 RepID=A0ABY5J372_9BACT|nr:nuclease-related domain-containing protein [Mycoplasmopsis equigenitalium]UUD37179.1 NERD domain-containing protein [Mycoplasmopsis equigenitalium]VEU69515.1 Nuclease-related domain [Mycoplasmopsis californica]